MCDKIRSIKDQPVGPVESPRPELEPQPVEDTSLPPPVVHGPPSARLTRRAASAKVPGTYFTEVQFDTRLRAAKAEAAFDAWVRAEDEPSGELKDLIDRTATAVAHKGIEFEGWLRTKHVKFPFLRTNGPYHSYYCSKLIELNNTEIA